MKKKLLIAMGDSLTEGVGCYDYSKMSNVESTYFDLTTDESKYQLDRFHKLGWPNRLGKKLNYDKVINIGWGGSSQSAHIKLFVEKILPNDYSEYDVLVVWMMTDPARFSFYSHGRISQFLPNLYHQNSKKMELGYIEEIGDIEFDSNLETVFYIKCFEQICENNNFNLQICCWHEDSSKNIFELYPSKYEMKPHLSNYIAKIYPEESGMRSRVCSHPNENGYEDIANNMFNSIYKFNSHLINKNKVENFEWEWDGEPKMWNNII